MKMIEDQTSYCVQFIERQNESNWIYIHSGDNFFSKIGMEMGQQELSFPMGWNLFKNMVVQGLITAVGFRLVSFFASYQSINFI